MNKKYIFERHYQFVTFCTLNKKCVLGKIKNNRMHLSIYGFILKQYIETFKRINSDIIVENYIIMPNHFHILCSEIWKDNQVSIHFKMKDLKRTFHRDLHRIILESDFFDDNIYGKEMYEKVSNYVENNVKVWEKDMYYR